MSLRSSLVFWREDGNNSFLVDEVDKKGTEKNPVFFSGGRVQRKFGEHLQSTYKEETPKH